MIGRSFKVGEIQLQILLLSVTSELRNYHKHPRKNQMVAVAYIGYGMDTQPI
jgi:hypothetical protein